MRYGGIEVNVKRVAFPCVATLILATFSSPRVAAQQQMSKQSRESAETMLQNIATTLRKIITIRNFMVSIGMQSSLRQNRRLTNLTFSTWPCCI